MRSLKDQDLRRARLLTYVASLLLLGASACSDTPPPAGDDDVSQTDDEATGADDDDAPADDDVDEPGDDDEDDDDDNVKPKPTPTPDGGVKRMDGSVGGSLDGGPRIPDGSSGGGTDGTVVTPAPDASVSPGGGNNTRPLGVAVKGPYTVKTYTEGLSDPAYASSMMYYPEGYEGTMGAVAFSPGFTATKEDYTYLGQMLASNGFATLLTTPTSTSDQPPARGTDLQAAVARIGMENTREGSPLKGKLNGKVCITGQSMGGGGTLHGANALGGKIACAVPLQPWQPGGTFARITAPTLFIGAQRDTIASVSGNALPHYRSIPDSVEKVYAEMAGADHYYSTNRNQNHETEAHIMVAWYHLHLDGDQRYRDYIYGAMKRTMGVSMYLTSKM